MIADAHVDLLIELAYRERRLAEADVFAQTWLPLLESGGVCLLLSLEGVECFGVETWPADLFHELGVRMAGLTWNRRNPYADGAAEDGGGLSPRNLDDAQLLALAGADGLFGLMLHPLAIDAKERTIDRVIDHLEHAAGLIGVDRICLGGDFTRRLWEAIPPFPEPKDGLTPPGLEPGTGIDDLAGPEHYPNLLAGLDRRGWSAADITAVTRGNLLRFLRASL